MTDLACLAVPCILLPCPVFTLSPCPPLPCPSLPCLALSSVSSLSLSLFLSVFLFMSLSYVDLGLCIVLTCLFFCHQSSFFILCQLCLCVRVFLFSFACYLHEKGNCSFTSATIESRRFAGNFVAYKLCPIFVNVCNNNKPPGTSAQVND